MIGWGSHRLHLPRPTSGPLFGGAGSAVGDEGRGGLRASFFLGRAGDFQRSWPALYRIRLEMPSQVSQSTGLDKVVFVKTSRVSRKPGRGQPPIPAWLPCRERMACGTGIAIRAGARVPLFAREAYPSYASDATPYAKSALLFSARKAHFSLVAGDTNRTTERGPAEQIGPAHRRKRRTPGAKLVRRATRVRAQAYGLMKNGNAKGASKARADSRVRSGRTSVT